MNKAKYSDNVSKLATVQQAMERYKLSRNSLLKVGEDAGAIRRLRRAVRIDIQKMDEYIDKNC